MPDHLAIGPNTDAYPYGKFPLPSSEPWLEPVTTLAAIAGATRRIRLATGVLIAPLRPALLLAKSLATLDVLCGGRVDLGVGLGWQNLLKPAPDARTDFLPDRRVWAILYSWRMPGFDIDGDGFVGTPIQNQTVLNPTGHPSEGLLSVSLRNGRLVDTGVGRGNL